MYITDCVSMYVWVCECVCVFVCVCVCVCVCVYKMVVEITKETWTKCGIKTLIYHRWIEEKINELCQKMSHIETQLGHWNIVDPVLKRIR